MGGMILRVSGGRVAQFSAWIIHRRHVCGVGTMGGMAVGIGHWCRIG
jgi:hypothetical protein